MRKSIYLAVCAVMLVCSTTSCRNRIERKIAGTYQQNDLIGQTFEFKDDKTFISTTKTGTIDCTIKLSGTWKVKGDSLFIFNDSNGVTYEFADSISIDAREKVMPFYSMMTGSRPAKTSFKVIGLTDAKLTLESNGLKSEYIRVDSLLK